MALSTGVFVLFFALGLVASEILLRAHGVGPMGVSTTIRWMFKETPEGVILTTPGWRGEQTVEGRTTRVRLNGLGMRGPEVPREKAAGERRVLMLGDSFVWGYGVAEEETFAALLERRLAAEGACSVRVGNAGAPSYGLRKQVATLRRARDAFQPDVVVACVYVGNDFADDARQLERVVDGYWLFDWSARFAEVSWRGRNMIRFRTALLAERWLSRHVPALAIDRERIEELTRAETDAGRALPQPRSLFMDGRVESESIVACLERSERALAELRELAAPAPVLVVLIPTAHHMTESVFEAELRRYGCDPASFERGRVGSRMRAAVERLGLEFLDLMPLLTAQPDPFRHWQPVGRHFSVEGNAKVAEWLDPVVRRLLGC